MTLHALIDFVLHLDRHLGAMVHDYGPWAYGILFLIVFCETGLVITPFLPGDSLLFAAGSLAGLGSLSLPRLVAVLFAAAVIGDNTNYWVGRQLGSRAFTHDYRWLRRDYLERTHAFFERYGPRTVILARFVPIVRTFTPFVAGVGAMGYPRFLGYDLAGGLAWVGLFSCAGYWFGNLPRVRENFSLVLLGIIVISILPIVVEFARSMRRSRADATSREST